MTGNYAIEFGISMLFFVIVKRKLLFQSGGYEKRNRKFLETIANNKPSKVKC